MALEGRGGKVVLQSRIDIGSMDVFYREAGARDAPVLVLPHGYPCSSFQFRHLFPLLADRWRLLAPDFPGCGYSGTPADFCYEIDGYVDFLECFLTRLGVRRYSLYLHDFSVHIGLRLAIRYPQRVTALVIQNGDIYRQRPVARRQFPSGSGAADESGEYRLRGGHWRRQSMDSASHEDVVSEHRFTEEFINEVGPRLAERIPAELWKVHWALMTPQRCEITCRVLAALKYDEAWLPRYQAYMRAHRPAAQILWGRHDACIPERSAYAYLRDLPGAEVHLLDGGHWLLETHVGEVAALLRGFLGRLTHGR
jgi:pimeloyl-ACP methyl ester carboxylesterase